MHLALSVLFLQLSAVAQPAVHTDRNAIAQHTVASSEKSSFAHIQLVDWKPADGRTSASSDTRSAANNVTPANDVTAARSLPGLYVAPTPEPPFKAGRRELRHSDRLWATLVLAQHSAATFDAWSTPHALSGDGRFEADPLMRPFANSPALYGAIQVGPALLDYVGRRMNRSQNKWAHRFWWVPQTAATAGFLFSGSHNLVNSR